MVVGTVTSISATLLWVDRPTLRGSVETGGSNYGSGLLRRSFGEIEASGATPRFNGPSYIVSKMLSSREEGLDSREFTFILTCISIFLSHVQILTQR